MTKKKRNCKRCYKDKRKEQKTSVKRMGYETYLCFLRDRNCAVFKSVSVIVCVVLHFQWLPCLNVMKSVILGIVKTCQCYNKRNNYCILPCGVEH